MNFIIGLLVFLLILNALVLILLVLVQLPKKDAGAGMAFGGGAADALFGAGSGNALTKITKYATIIFFALAVFVGHMENSAHSSNAATFEKQVQQQQQQAPITAPPAAKSATPAANSGLLTMPSVTGTNK
jgi:preprotein translocase subunit SecG